MSQSVSRSLDPVNQRVSQCLVSLSVSQSGRLVNKTLNNNNDDNDNENNKIITVGWSVAQSVSYSVIKRSQITAKATDHHQIKKSLCSWILFPLLASVASFLRHHSSQETLRAPSKRKLSTHLK